MNDKLEQAEESLEAYFRSQNKRLKIRRKFGLDNESNLERVESALKTSAGNYLVPTSPVLIRLAQSSS